MAVVLRDLVADLSELMDVPQFKDYCPNGLQVEGRSEVQKIVSGVTACQALIDEAVHQGADAVLVHHGYFWRGEDAVLTGMKRQRILTLLNHGISLLAYHLPLDAHPVVGNNVQLGKVLGLEASAELTRQNNHAMGLLAQLPQAMTAEALSALLTDRLHRTPLHIGETGGAIERVAWCTGAAQSYIHHALAAGADAFISGEVSEQTTHIAREEGIHYFAAGHHATERYGVQALGQWLAEHYSLEHSFVDIDNPV